MNKAKGKIGSVLLLTSLVLMFMQTAVSATTATVLVNDFESGVEIPYASKSNLDAGGWSTSLDTTVGYDNSTSSDKLVLDLSKRTNTGASCYVTVKADNTTGALYQGFSCMVKTSNFKALSLRIYDKYNELFDLRLLLDTSNLGWQEMVFPAGWEKMDTATIPHFSKKNVSATSATAGNNANVIDYPIKSYGFIIEGSSATVVNMSNNVNTIWIDNVKSMIEPDNAVSNVNFKIGSTSITQLTKGQVNCLANASNYCYTDGMPIVYTVALYDGNKMVQVHCVTTSVPFNTTAPISALLDVPDLTTGNFKIKVFSWRGFESMTPIPVLKDNLSVIHEGVTFDSTGIH